MQEIETKILEVDTKEVEKKLLSLGAKKIQDIGFVVDWYGPKGLTHKGDDPYFLRVRSYSDGKVEVTCKWKPEIMVTARRVKEVNVMIDDHDRMKLLFESIGLENYAHQEKKRISWKLQNVQFDLDTYPKMPTYLEIEAKSEKEINNMIKKMNLEKHESWNDGERTLITKKYKLNWFNMYF